MIFRICFFSPCLRNDRSSEDFFAPLFRSAVKCHRWLFQPSWLFLFFFFRFRPRVNSYRNGALSCPSPPLLDRVQLCRNIIFLCVKASFCGISKALKNRLEAASSTTSGIFCFPESYLISLSFSYKFKNVLFLRIGVDTIVSSFRSQFLWKKNYRAINFHVFQTFAIRIVRPNAMPCAVTASPY